MPAKSKSQQRLFGMVHAYQKGSLKPRDVDSKYRKKLKQVASTIKPNDAEKFARTKHKGLPEVKESKKITFKEYLVEMSQKEQEALIPPVAIQKIYNDLKNKYGVVKRDVFLQRVADTFNLTPEGMRRLVNLRSVANLAFDDDVGNAPIAPPRDPWSHVSQKAQRREDRARQHGVKIW